MRNPAAAYPALTGGLAQMIIAVITSFSFHLSVTDTAAIQAATIAVIGFVVALRTRPFAYSAVTGLLAAGAGLLLAFKVHGITAGEVSAFNAIVAMFAFKLVHQAVSPVPPQPVTPPGHSAP